MIYSVNKNSEIQLEESILQEEKVFFKFKKKDEVPEDFRKCALNLIDTIEKELNADVAEGFMSAAYGINIGDIRKRINKKIKNCYFISFPYVAILKAKGIHVKFIDKITVPNEKIVRDFCSKVVKKCSFKEVSSKSIVDGFVKNGKDSIYGLNYVIQDNRIVIYLRCLEDTKENRDVLAGGKRFNEAFFESSTISSEAINHNKEDLTPNEDGFESLTPEKLYGFDPELGLTRSEELASDSSYSDFFRDPKIMETFTEHLDLTDSLTRKAVITMNEAEQSAVLTDLTSKLYDNIVSKVDDIDYGEIPSTKGDITKLSNYNKLNECVELLRNILKEFKQDTGPIDEIAQAISNVSVNKELFMRAYKFNCELPIIMYNNIVLSIINGVSYMIATCIEFMKTPNQDSFQITLDKVSYAKTKNHLIYNNLKRFNKACASGDLQKGMEHILQNRIKGFGEAAVGAWAASLSITVGLIAIIIHIIPILREIVYFFYYNRMRVSDFLDIQADLLQMNAYNVENDPNKDEEQKKRIVSKQLKIVELFRKMANKISFTSKKAEVETTKEIANNAKKMKINDVTKELPDSVSALF